MESRRNRKKTTKKKRTLVIVVSLLVLVAVITMGTYSYTSRSEFCATCHEMLPEFMTWQVSSHKNIGCVKCHENTNPITGLKQKISYLGEVYLHFTNKYTSPIQIKESLGNQSCLSCHQGKIEPKVKNLIFSHQKHLDERITCIACHAGITHGKIAERGKSDQEAYDSWQEVTAKKEMIAENVNPNMGQCISCHKIRKMPTDCKTCHINVGKPASHNNLQWQEGHGADARNNLTTCQKCHQNSLQLNDASQELDLVTYARTTEFCYQCHLNSPPSHLNSAWQTGHSVKAKISRTDCLICHRDSYGEKKPNENVATANCADCH